MILKGVREMIDFAITTADKFIEKVESGKARSVETYNDMKELKKKAEEVKLYLRPVSDK